MTRIPRAAYATALKTASRWLERNDVMAVGLGLRRREGKFTEEPCIVVTVRWKRKPKRLKDLGISPLPGLVRTRAGAKVHHVPVDVQETGGRKRGKPHGLVACPLTTSDNVWGMVGAIVARSGSRFVLTAAHVAREVGTPVTVQTRQGSVGGTTIEVHDQDNLDHALIESDAPLPRDASSLPGGKAIAGLRAVSTVKLGEDAFFLTRDGQVHQVTIAKINETVAFDMPNGMVSFSGVISTELNSKSGDSGTLLYDENFRAVGTLIGEFAGMYSCFMPCQPSFGDIHVVLA